MRVCFQDILKAEFHPWTHISYLWDKLITIIYFSCGLYLLWLHLQLKVDTGFTTDGRYPQTPYSVLRFCVFALTQFKVCKIWSACTLLVAFDVRSQGGNWKNDQLVHSTKLSLGLWAVITHIFNL